ncbi:hypothetical protein [Serratia liquefaciens]|uniref:hypothetical protein n=1 Tax=Serratia liquefaciens TaxID=614 RepID=UPI00217A7243|nr:hypothetical protein [Serratia liquefaciens]CAI1683942.1 Uncharacterised protein [Serratia liquefaciens]
MIKVYEEEEGKFVVWGDYAFIDVEYIEDVVCGGVILVAYIFDCLKKEVINTNGRQVICNEWYLRFHGEVVRGQIQYGGVRNFKHFRSFLQQLI